MSAAATDPAATIKIGLDEVSAAAFTFTEIKQLGESNSIFGSTSGHFSSYQTSDLVFAQADGLHWRQYDGSDDFNGSVVFETSEYGYVQAAELNGDSTDDIMALGTPGSTSDTNSYIGVWTGNSSLASSSQAPFDAPIVRSIQSGDAVFGNVDDSELYFQDMSFADFDNDGDLDVIVAALNMYTIVSELPTGKEEYAAYGKALTSIGLNGGDGEFVFMAWQATGDGSEAKNITSVAAAIDVRVSAGDFNGDGYMDAAIGIHPLAGTGVGDLDPAPAYVVWGDSSLLDGTPTFDYDDDNKYSNDWNDPEDVEAVRPSATATSDQLVIAFDKSTHIASFNADKTLDNDNKIDGTPRGNLGTSLDYNSDGSPDIMFADGDSSSIGVGYDWTETASGINQVTGMHLGTNILNSTGIDIDGDGKPDFVGSDGDQIYAYLNTTDPSSQYQAVELREGTAIAGRQINGVPGALLDGDGDTGFTLSVVADISAFDNALGWFKINPDGTFGEARFIDADTPAELDTLAEGERLGLFLVSDGYDLNDQLEGSFRFVDAVGRPADLGDAAPNLVSTTTGGKVIGDIFHTADADPFDAVNRLNDGGRIQALSRQEGPDGDVLIGFEDMRLLSGDADFNDVVLRLVRTSDADGLV